MKSNVNQNKKKGIKHIILSFRLQKNFLQMCPVPLCENCLKWNQKLPNSGKQKCAWTSVNLLKNRGESPQRCHKLTVLEKSSLWDMLSCGCHCSLVDWLFVLLGSETKVAAASVGSGRLSERTFPLRGVSSYRGLSA